MASARRDRPRRRPLTWLVLLGVAAVAAYLLLRCGDGWGVGTGGGEGVGTTERPRPATATLPDGGLRRCALRVDSDGIMLDGARASIADAIAGCRAGGAADVVVTGDARQGTWDELRAALAGAGIATYVKGTPVPPPPDASTP